MGYIVVVVGTGEPSGMGEIQWATNTCTHTIDEGMESQPVCSQLSADGDLLVVGMASGCIDITRFNVS